MADYIIQPRRYRFDALQNAEGIKRRADIAQDFAKEYNKNAQWLGLPQVPTPFLKDL